MSETKSQEQTHLEKWLRSRLVCIHEAGACSRVALYHEAEGSKNPSLLTEWPVNLQDDTNGELQEAFISTTASEILSYAQREANVSKSVQRYVIRAGYGPTFTAKGRHVIRLGPVNEEEDEFSELDTEGRNPRGAFSQMMRHNEALTRLMVNNNDATVKNLVGALGVMGNMLTTALEKWGQASIAANEALDRRDERVALMRANEEKAKNDAEVMRMLTHAIPVVANRLAGGQIIPQRATPPENMISALFGGMTEEQINAFISVLKPEQIVVLGELVNAVKKKEDNNSEPALPLHTL